MSEQSAGEVIGWETLGGFLAKWSSIRYKSCSFESINDVYGFQTPQAPSSNTLESIKHLILNINRQSPFSQISVQNPEIRVRQSLVL